MIETQSYADFSRVVHEEVNPLRIPVNVTIEVTNRCPLECAHCYNNLPMADGDARRRELTTADYRRVLDELAELGCLWILFTGGEILARADFFEIYTYARSKGFLITLFTNGTLITERVADFLAANPPFDIEITLYGRTKSTYESLTGIPGSFEKCIRGIHLLLDRKLPLKLKTVALTINRHEIRSMRQFAEDLGVEFKFDPMINPRIDCSSSPLAVRLTPEELVEMDLRDSTRVDEWRRLARDFKPTPVAPGATQHLYDCGGGVNSFAIDPYGDLTICVLSHFDKFNLRRGSFAEGWDFLHRIRTKPATHPIKCDTCGLKSMCGMCPANGELEHGDPEKPVDFLCRTAHLRAATFGVELTPHGDCEYCNGGEREEEIQQSAAQLLAGAPAVPIAALAAASSCGSGGCSSCHAQ